MTNLTLEFLSQENAEEIFEFERKTWIFLKPSFHQEGIELARSMAGRDMPQRL